VLTIRTGWCTFWKRYELNRWYSGVLQVHRHAERSASAVKHPCTGFLATPRNDKERVLGMTRKRCSEWQKKACGMFYAVMLNAVKHPCTGFLTTPRNDKERVLGMTKDKCGTVPQNLHIQWVLQCFVANFCYGFSFWFGSGFCIESHEWFCIGLAQMYPRLLQL